MSFHLCIPLLLLWSSALFASGKIELPSDMKELVDEITPNFEANLRRAFKNEGIRIQKAQSRRGNYVHKLDDVLLSLEDTKIELKNLRFPWIPDFRIGELSANLQMSCLDLDLNLGSLRVEGEYEANNTALRTWLPVSHVGRIVIVFSNVRAVGKVGLVMKEDSFVPQNYDIQYDPSEVTVRVSYHVDSDNKIENEITNSNIDETLGKTVWGQLTEVMSNLLHRQLGEVVVEFSATELLVDRDEEFRLYAKAQEAKANRLLDSLLCAAKDFLVSSDSRKVRTPSFDVIYRGKASSVQQGTLKTGDGYVLDLASLTRPQTFSLFEDKNKLSIYGSISLREFKHGYDRYESSYEETAIEGSIKGQIYKNQIFVKITLKKEGERCSAMLDSSRFIRVRDIDLDVSGLASLSWLDERLKSWVVGNLREAVLPKVESHVRAAITHAIEHTDCVAFLVD